MKILYKTDQYSQQRQMEKPVDIYPVRLAMEATHDLALGHDVTWNNPKIGRHYDEVVAQPRYKDFLSLPIPNRIFTLAHSKRYQMYGNYKHRPATHMMVADGCWHGKCTFCIEKGRGYQIRPLQAVSEEIDLCQALGYREIFDDSGTFPDGRYMDNFCSVAIAKNYRMILGCNMRIGADVDFNMMRMAGFRMVLFGVESANQKTLDRLQKGIYAADIIPTIKAASQAGLEPHIAVMFGYPWESKKEELRTLDLVHFLLRKGYAKTAQASTYAPPRSRPIVGSLLCHHIYDIARHPEFWFNKIRDINGWEDFIYLLKGIRKGIVHD